MVVLVLSISCWFATGAALPSLSSQFDLDAAGRLWLTVCVQIGFAVGAVTLGLLRLADRFRPSTLIPIGAVGAGVVTLIPLLGQPTMSALLFSRFLVGVALAVIYPTAIRATISWFSPRARGLAVGAVVASLTIGTASPQLLAGSPLGDWRQVLVVTAAAAMTAALLALLLRSGPETNAIGRTSVSDILAIMKDPIQRRITIGYAAHMWEAYGMWVWLPAFLIAGTTRLVATGDASATGMISFIVIGLSGALGCMAGGALSARFGKRVIARWSVLISGACAIATPLLGLMPGWLCLAVLALWGMSIISDSPLYSALAGDLAAGKPVGTTLALQMGIGYVTSAAAIAVTGAVSETVGWNWALLVLAPGAGVAVFCLRPWKRTTSRTTSRRIYPAG